MLEGERCTRQGVVGWVCVCGRGMERAETSSDRSREIERVGTNLRPGALSRTAVVLGGRRFVGSNA